MALSDNRWQRMLTLCALYVAQGVPWGFMMITLPVYLASKYQVSDSEIGNLTAIILVPWSFKLIWAPLMDSMTIRSMGRRRPWIIGAELMMAVSLLGFVGLENPSENLNYILTLYFVHNCFASLQDVCTDALAVDVLPYNEQGRMNSLMWVSKLIGKGVGAAGLSVVLDKYGIESCAYVQIAILLGIMLIPIFLLERPGEKRFPWSAGQAGGGHTANIKNPLETIGAFLTAYRLPTNYLYLIFTLTYLIGTGINEIVTKTLYTQQLEPKWTDVELSELAGLYTIIPIILASIGGGYLADRFGRRFIILLGFGGYGLSAIVFAVCTSLWNEHWFAATYMVTFDTLNAVGSVGFLSLAMRISWTTAAATVFTTYMTLSNLSHIVGHWLAGPVRNWLTFGDAGNTANMLSYELTFWLVGLVNVLPLLMLYWVRPSEVDMARAEEDATTAGATSPEEAPAV